MATKKTTTKKVPAKKPAAKKTATKKKATSTEEKAEASTPRPAVGPRHPKARVTEAHGGKEALAKALAPSLARGDEDTETVAGKLKTASNTQLLRLQRVVDAVKQKWGSRDKLIEAIGNAEKKSKDKDYLAKLASYSLPQLFDLATSTERRARA